MKKVTFYIIKLFFSVICFVLALTLEKHMCCDGGRYYLSLLLGIGYCITLDTEALIFSIKKGR